MIIDNHTVKLCSQKILKARMRILNKQGFYGMLLMHISFNIMPECSSISTDGEKIYFKPEYIMGLTNAELDFMLLHQVLHIVLSHCARREGKQRDVFDLACDIVVNSNILENSDFTSEAQALYDLPHKGPNGEEGLKFTAEEVYEMLMKQPLLGDNDDNDDNESGGGRGDDDDNDESGGGSGDDDDDDESGSGGGNGENDQNGSGSNSNEFKDDHSQWDNVDSSADKEIEKTYMIAAAAESSMRREEFSGDKSWGSVPMFAKILLKELKEPQTDWLTILNAFLQEEITDYSFTPPDRRFSDSDFFLPDFNEKEYTPKKILFMIDTSGSMSVDMITAAYSEVKGALDQFNGKLTGWLGFFDAAVVEPQPFEDEEEFQIIYPLGGGGTSFACIFEYVFNNMQDDLPVSIIILTDGDAPFPMESDAQDIPVLWIINNDEINPPWGNVARIK